MDTYKATNTENGKFYIGSTTDFESRKREHLRSKANYPFQNALRKNPDLFEWEVWRDNSENREMEQALLDMWFGKEQCYNLNPGANGGWKPWIKGQTWVNNGEAEKYLPCECELPEGWKEGRLPIKESTRKKNSKSQKERKDNPFKKKGEESMSYGRRWVTTPEKDEEKYLKPGEEPPEGWVFGRMKRPSRGEESRNRTRQALKGKPKSEQHKENLKKAALDHYLKKGKTNQLQP
jgi:hypothetical protein